MHYYEDRETYRLVESVSAITNMPLEEIWENYGAFLIQYTMESGWDDILNCLSSNLKGFLDNLDALHYFIDHVVYQANLRGPSFRCVANADESLTLHYYSQRSGLYPIVKGVVREAALKIYQLNIEISMTGRTQRTVNDQKGGQKMEEHVVFRINILKTGIDHQQRSSTTKNLSPKLDPKTLAAAAVRPFTGQPEQTAAAAPSLLCLGERHDRRGTSMSTGNLSGLSDAGSLHSDMDIPLTTVSMKNFAEICPYHVVFDQDCTILQCGKAIASHYSGTVGSNLSMIMELIRPDMTIDFYEIINFVNAVFVLRLRTVREISQAGMVSSSPVHNPAAPRPVVVVQNAENDYCIRLKGQMMQLSCTDKILFIGSPYITSIPELLKAGLHINSLPIRDATRDLILLNQQRLTDVEAHKQLEDQKQKLEKMSLELSREKLKAQALLKEVLPETVAAQLMEGKRVDACEFESVTVLFSDIPNFQNIVTNANPSSIVKLLDDIFTKFDRLVGIHGIYKVETVGDSYMVVGGAPDHADNHAELVGYVGLGMLWEARSTTDPVNQEPIQVRVGIHTGPIVTGVVGKKMPRFLCLYLFGEKVLSVRRYGEHCIPDGKPRSCRAAQKTGKFIFTPRGETQIKGKGPMYTYWLIGSRKKSLWELVDRERGIDDTIDGYYELNASGASGASDPFKTAVAPVPTAQQAAQNHPPVTVPAVSSSKTCRIT